MDNNADGILSWLDREKFYRFVIFSIALFVIPTFGVMAVIAGVVPTIMYFPMLFGPLIVLALPHLALYGGLLYFLSRVISELIMYLPARSYRVVTLGMVLLGFAYIAGLEIYLPMSHSRKEATTLSGILN